MTKANPATRIPGGNTSCNIHGIHTPLQSIGTRVHTGNALDSLDRTHSTAAAVRRFDLLLWQRSRAAPPPHRGAESHWSLPHTPVSLHSNKARQKLKRIQPQSSERQREVMLCWHYPTDWVYNFTYWNTSSSSIRHDAIYKSCSFFEPSEGSILIWSHLDELCNDISLHTGRKRPSFLKNTFKQWPEIDTQRTHVQSHSPGLKIETRYTFSKTVQRSQKHLSRAIPSQQFVHIFIDVYEQHKLWDSNSDWQTITSWKPCLNIARNKLVDTQKYLTYLSVHYKVVHEAIVPQTQWRGAWRRWGKVAWKRQKPHASLKDFNGRMIRDLKQFKLSCLVKSHNKLPFSICTSPALRGER